MESMIQKRYNEIEEEVNAGLQCGYYLGYANAIMSLRIRKLIPFEDASKILNELSELYKISRKNAESIGVNIKDLPEDVPHNLAEAVNLESLMKKIMESVK